MSKKPTIAKPQTFSKMSGTYDGAELRPYVGRPGAMDAFAKPSRMGDSLHAHRPMIGMASSAVPDYAAKSK